MFSIAELPRRGSVQLLLATMTVTFADKFGVVWLVTLWEDSAEQVSVDIKPVSILGHYCSIITSMVWTSSKFYITCAMDLYVLHLFSSECVYWQTHKVCYTSVWFVTPFVSCITMLCHLPGIAEVFARWAVHCYCWQGLQNTSMSSVLCTDCCINGAYWTYSLIVLQLIL